MRAALLAVAALLLVLLPAAPADALTECVSQSGARACAIYAPYYGSLYCEKTGTEGYGGIYAWAFAPSGWGSGGQVTYYCENVPPITHDPPYQESMVFTYTTAAGHTLVAGWTGYKWNTQETCFVFYGLDAPSTWIYCPNVPAPYGTALTGLFRTYVSVNADCKAGTAPTAQLCLRGTNSAFTAAATLCDPASSASVRVAGTTAASPQAGAATCLVFKTLLG